MNHSFTCSYHLGGLDFDEVDTVIAFTPGVTQSCLDIIIVNDQSLESTELFTISVASAGDSSVEIGPLSFTTIMILDNDSMSQY